MTSFASIKKILAAAVLGTGLVALAGCGEESASEKAAERSQEESSEASKALEAAKEKAKEEKAKEFLKVAKVLLQKPADPNVSLEWEGHQSTCMLAAASSKAPDSSALDMIHLLLMQRADPKATTEGRTVLSVADAEGNRAEYLLDRLLRGEGQEYTDLVQNLLQEARDTEDDTRQQRLREPVRTILGRDQKARP